MSGRHLAVVPPPAAAAEPGPAAPPHRSGPLPIAVDIARLLRALPPPLDPDPAGFQCWLADQADLLDRVAAAAADEALAADVRTVAAAARYTLTTLALPVPVPIGPTGSAGPGWGGDAA
jgi:hypothetical protein